MMTHGTTEQALLLAKTRWAMLNRFDLEDQTWLDLFGQFGAPTVIEALKALKHCHSSIDAVRYAFFIRGCERIAATIPRIY